MPSGRQPLFVEWVTNQVIGCLYSLVHLVQPKVNPLPSTWLPSQAAGHRDSAGLLAHPAASIWKGFLWRPK